MPDSPLLAAWKIQSRVIFALLMREVITRYGRHNIGFLWLFVEPMLFTVGVTVLWTATKAVHGSNIPIVAFALTGYSSVLLWRNMPARCIGSVGPNLALMYHRYVKMIDIYYSRLLLEVAGATTSFIGLGLFFWFIGWLAGPEDVVKVIEGWILLAWFGAALAIFLGALSEVSELVEKIWHPAAYLLFPLSGAAFLVSSLPPGAQEVLLYLPMVHGVELLREGYFGSQIAAHYDISYMLTCNLVLTLFALAQVARVSSTVVPE
jgi:ABC-type polysaccharide/polyol phosphate export permease